MNKMVYIQSVDLPKRYLSQNGSDWRIYLLPFSFDTTVFTLRPCLWQLLQQTYSNLTCVSLEVAHSGPRKYLRHGNHRAYLELSGDQNQGQSPNFAGDTSFLLVGDAMNFRLRSTVAMQINTVIWLQYYLPNYAVYVHSGNEITDFDHFRFVLR
jgi:hypothetical protein